MKKKIAVMLTAVMVFGAAGCSALGGGKFKSASNKVINAAKKACDAEEADKKQKKKILDKLQPTDDVFEDGCYYQLTKDDIEDADFNFDEIDNDDVKNATIVVKAEGNTAFVCYVIEFGDEDAAEDYFDEMMEKTEDFDEDDLEEAADKSDLEYGINDEDDDAYALMYYSEDYDMAGGFYFKREGKIVYAVIYSGSADTDLIEEYYDFMKQCKFEDMEELLDS